MEDSSSESAYTPAPSKTAKPSYPARRMKYATRACTECKRRKIRCSGDEPCRNCTSSRNRICTFETSRRRKRQTPPTVGPQPPVTMSDSKLEALTHTRREIVQALRTNNPGATFSPSHSSKISEAVTPFSFHKSAVVGTHPLSNKNLSCDFVPSRLQPNDEVGFLLKFCFDELEIYYPCIDRADFYGRLFTLLGQHCSHENTFTLIPNRPECLGLAALACAILALATYMSGQSASDEVAHNEDDYVAMAWEWHSESRRLLRAYSWNNEPSLDVLRLHILEVLFYTMLQKNKALSTAKAVAVDLAFALELNNEAAWGVVADREREYRRLLWWMVYIIDRRISIRTSRPYLIQESDFSVGVFTSASRICYLSNSTFEAGPSRIDIPFNMIRWPQPSRPGDDWFAYLQFNVGWSSIAARVWDSCCSLRTLHAVDLNEIDSIDGLLLNLEHSLPPSLLWKQDGLLDLVQAGISDMYLRLRLIMFEKINTLRLLIHSCPRTRAASMLNQHTALTETIASDTIDSAVGYLSIRNQARPWCTYLTLLLVDVSSRIAPIVECEADVPTTAAYRTVLSIINAQECLRALANNKLSITRKALARLTEISGNMNLALSRKTSFSIAIDADNQISWTNDDGDEAASSTGLGPGLMDIGNWIFDASKIWQAGELADLLSSEGFFLDFSP